MAVSREIHLVTPKHAILKSKYPLSTFVERELNVLNHSLLKWETRKEEVAPRWEQISVKAEGQTTESLQGWVVALSNAVSDYYLSSWEPMWVDRYIQECFEVGNTKEMKLIRRYCTEELADSQPRWTRIQEESLPYVPYQNVSCYGLRRWRILDPVTRHLQYHDDINLEGFYHFRLQKYRDLLYRCVEHAVEEYIIDREYQEFISLLQTYVQWIPPKCAVMHLCQVDDGTYRLYHENGKMVTEEQVALMLDEQVIDVEWEDMSYDDLIVSILMNLSPSKIVAHLLHQEYGQIFYTVKAIFQERVEVEMKDQPFQTHPH